MAKRFGIGKDAIARVWADHNLKPWRVDNFKLANDPHFEEKLVDVVGLYLKPPARAVVFSFDEKTQCQAMDRTQPSLPMVPGRAGMMTHDYKRNGTTDLFAAMNLATGQVLTHCHKGHTARLEISGMSFDLLASDEQSSLSSPLDAKRRANLVGGTIDPASNQHSGNLGCPPLHGPRDEQIQRLRVDGP